MSCCHIFTAYRRHNISSLRYKNRLQLSRFMHHPSSQSLQINKRSYGPNTRKNPLAALDVFGPAMRVCEPCETLRSKMKIIKTVFLQIWLDVKSHQPSSQLSCRISHSSQTHTEFSSLNIMDHVSNGVCRVHVHRPRCEALSGTENDDYGHMRDKTIPALK